MLSAQTFRRNSDVDADRKAPFGPRDQLARITRHYVPRLFQGTIARSLRRVQPLGPTSRRRYVRVMFGRARLSTDGSEIPLPAHPEHRAYWQRSAWLIIYLPEKSAFCGARLLEPARSSLIPGLAKPLPFAMAAAAAVQDFASTICSKAGL